MSSSEATKKQVPIKEGFLTQPLWPLEGVRLMASRCARCGETFLGKRTACENCQSHALEDVVLNRRGKLHSFTVNRHRPPGDYVGPDPYVPMAVGLVELPEGLRIISPLTDCDVDALKVDMDVELVIEKLCEDEEGNEVITYRFRPV